MFPASASFVANDRFRPSFMRVPFREERLLRSAQAMNAAVVDGDDAGRARVDALDTDGQDEHQRPAVFNLRKVLEPAR